MPFSNFHTHSTFCDGADSPEALVQEAIALHCPAIGFSSHSPADYDEAGLPPARVAAYQAEIRRLRAVYGEQIQILLGIEQEYYSTASTLGYDYVIGGVHYLRHGKSYRSVDLSREQLISIVEGWFCGDWYAMAEEYYRLVGDLYEKTHCRVIAHFDLIEKFNEDGSLFDRDHPRYRAAALGALEKLQRAPVLFEINTGAIARGYRKTPYPAPFLLDAMRRAHSPLLLASDCHNRRDLLCGFEDCLALAPEALSAPAALSPDLSKIARI